MKISTLLLAFLVLVTTACSSTDHEVEPVTIVASADEPHYSSINTLSERADVIIKGKVIDTRVEEISHLSERDSSSTNEKLNPGGNHESISRIYTVYTVEIEHAYKGNYDKGDTIEVKQLGGKIGNTTLVATEIVNITDENNYIFFLETYPKIPASLLNSIQSLYIYEPAPELKVKTRKQ